jgi:integrase
VGRDVASLRTRDRAEAERRGRQLLAELLRGAPARVSDEVTLGALWERFHRECPTYLDNAPKTKRDASCRVQVLFGHFGEACDVRSLTAHDINTYTTKRRAGGIVTAAGRTTAPVRARSVEADLVLLNTMLSWATTVRTAHGCRWLAENPLTGLRRIREQNPQRPIATWERYERTRTAMQDLGVSARSEPERSRWLKLELALVLAEGAGRRLSSIRQLHWDDIDFERHCVRWRAEADKKRREGVIPLPEELVS